MSGKGSSGAGRSVSRGAPVEWPDWWFAEPSVAELAAIEAEWPEIEADLVALDAEVRRLRSGGRLSDLDVRRVRRARRRVMADSVAAPLWSVA